MPSIQSVTPFDNVVEGFKSIVGTCYTGCTAIDLPVIKVTQKTDFLGTQKYFRIQNLFFGGKKIENFFTQETCIFYI